MSVVAVGQQAIESVLGARATELGVEIWRGAEVTGFDADDEGVTVELSDGPVRADWVVGCDGGRSLVRKAAGFEFPGPDPAITGRQALVEFDGPGDFFRGWNRTETGLLRPRPDARAGS